MTHADEPRTILNHENSLATCQWLLAIRLATQQAVDAAPETAFRWFFSLPCGLILGRN